MKIIFSCLSLYVALIVNGQGTFFDQSDQFFAKHVDSKGMVNYEAIKKNQSELNELVFTIARANYERYDANSRKAFLINSYNILVIREIVDLLPIDGPLENSAFFNGIKQQVGMRTVTLDQLEKDILNKEFADARLHFVLVCGAKGCPPLAATAYKPANLETQLDSRTRYVLNLDWFIKDLGSKVEYSEIFRWYKTDFEKNGSTLLVYVNKYRTKKIKSPDVSFYTYDWSLNSQN